MTDPSGYAKTLALPAGFDAPRLLRYHDATAHAITRDDLGADVRGINASLDLIRAASEPPRAVDHAGWPFAILRFAFLGYTCHSRRGQWLSGCSA